MSLPAQAADRTKLPQPSHVVTESASCGVPGSITVTDRSRLVVGQLVAADTSVDLEYKASVAVSYDGPVVVLATPVSARYRILAAQYDGTWASDVIKLSATPCS